MRKKREAERVEQQRREVEQRELQAKAEQERLRVAENLAQAEKNMHAYRTLTWAQHDSVPIDVSAVLAHVSIQVIAGLATFAAGAEGLAATALECRNDGRSIRDWMQDHKPATAEQVRTLAALLREGRLSTRGSEI